MGFRDVNRREYLKQPHIIVIGVVIIFVLIMAVYTGFRRINQMQTAASLETAEACQEFVDDENLCKFAAQNEQHSSQSFVSTNTTTDGNTTEINTLEHESAMRVRSVTLSGLTEIESYVIIDDTTYVKDYSDDTWAKYTDPDYQPSDDAIDYDFSSATTDDVVDFRDNYTAQGTEPCGNLTCYKYDVSYLEGDVVITTSIWFDTQEFLLRRYLSADDTVTSNTQFDYKSVRVTAPSPTKDVSQEQIEEYL